MQINITGHHIHITAALRDFITDKMGRIERHFDHITKAQVNLCVEKDRKKAEASVQLAGNELFAQCESTDMQSSIDGLLAKLDRQIVKHKEKTSSHRQRKLTQANKLH